MEQKAKQTARKATLHTWNVACLQNRTDGSCLPHEPGRTSQSNSRNTIIPLTCEAFRSCFKLIRMHICRYIYNIHAICCNMMLLQSLWTFKIAHSSIWLSCRCFCHFLATVFCCDKDWRLLSCLWPWSCGRNCRPCKPANSSFLARRRFLELHASVFSFFSFFPRWCFATFEDDTSCKPLFFFETLGELLLDWSETWDVLFSIWVCCCRIHEHGGFE